MTWYVIKYVTKLSFVHSGWASLWAQGSSDQLNLGQLTPLKAPLFDNFNYSKPNGLASLFGKAQPIKQIEQMASRSSFCRATLAVKPGSCSCKAAASVPPASKSDSKSDELGAPEKGTPTPSHVSAPSHASAPAPVKPILALKYNEADLMKILKIFYETKGQEPKSKVFRKRPLKVKVSDIYFGKLHMDCYHFCQ